MNIKIKVPFNRKHVILFVYNIPPWLIRASIIVALAIAAIKMKLSVL